MQFKNTGKTSQMPLFVFNRFQVHYKLQLVFLIKLLKDRLGASYYIKVSPEFIISLQVK